MSVQAKPATTTIQTSRREFLGGVAAGAAVLAVGFRPDGAIASGHSSAALNPFVKIAADGRVTAVIKHFEMGQGPATGLATLIAEELGVPMESISYEFAPSNPALYANFAFGQIQGTGGSTAMANSFMQYRTAGAAAREMLIAAAAKKWGVDPAGLDIADGNVTGGRKAVPLGKFVKAATAIQAPEKPRLKSPDEWRLIGNPDVRRLDGAIKTDGRAQYAMDLQLPNQMVTVIARAPRYGGKVAVFDASDAKGVKGFLRAAALPNGAGVAVYAENTWAAFQAREALNVDWDFSAAESRDSAEIRAEIDAALDAPPQFDVLKTGVADKIDGLMEGAAQIVERSFYFPLLAHAPMEPLTCTIAPDADGGVTLHDGCQIPTGPHGALAQILELPIEKVRIETMLAGGSFGRRATPSADYQVEAALAFALTGRDRPVKLVWSREDDLRSGYYRPAFGHKVRVGLDTKGKIVAWDHRIAGQSIMKGTPFEAFAVKDGIDGSSVEGVSDTPYQIPGMFVGLTDTKKATDTLWWRSVGHTHTAYAMEVMMDEAAQAAGRDPVEFRLAHLNGGKDQARKAGVLKLVAEKSGWGEKAPAGRHRGVAVHKSFNSYVAEVVEVSGDPASGVKIERVVCAVDCGIAVNPDIVKAQIEGGVGYGIGHAMRNEVTLTGGTVDQYNFPDYEPLRIGDIGTIEVHIVPSAEAPTGVGEPGVPPAAPALANAIARSSGDGGIVTALPMQNSGISFA